MPPVNPLIQELSHSSSHHIFPQTPTGGDTAIDKDIDADKRYHLVAEEADESFFNEHKTASRSPYRRSVRMGRGAHYYEGFKVGFKNI